MTGKRYRVLMFSPAFAPFANAEALVNSKLALAMIDAGWEIDVISRRLAGSSPIDYGSGWDQPWTELRKFTHEIDDYFDSNVQRILDLGEGVVLTGTAIQGCRWAGKAVRLASMLHRRQPFDVVLSRAFPESAHAAAMAFSRTSGVPWIANWNDPWESFRDGIPHRSLAQHIGLQRAWFCKQVGRAAGWHTFPAEGLRSAMTHYLGHRSFARSSVIPHAALGATINCSKKKNEKFTICYTGRLSKNQDPEMFFRGVKRFMREHEVTDLIRLRFIGLDEVALRNLVEKYGLLSNCSIEPGMSYMKALHAAYDSDVLLVIDPPTLNGIILTSKFVDYVQTGRPILAVSSINGTLFEILSRHGGGLAVDCSSEFEISNAIGKLFGGWCNDELESTYSSAPIFEYFSPKSIINAYDNLFRQLLKPQQSICP